MQALNRYRTIQVLVGLALSVPAGSIDEGSFARAVDQINRALLAGDWNAFRKLGLPAIAIEERWNAYDDFFVEQRGRQGMLGWHAQKSIEYRTVISNALELPKNHRRLFEKFCEQFRAAKERGTGSTNWVTVSSTYKKSMLDSYVIASPHVSAKIASNLDIAIEMEPMAQGWRAGRLIIVGH
jgi:hypothetical protein